MLESTAPSSFITPDELAERWAVPVRSLYKMKHYGKGPDAVKIGRRLRYRLTDVEAYEAANMVGSTK